MLRRLADVGGAPKNEIDFRRMTCIIGLIRAWFWTGKEAAYHSQFADDTILFISIK